MPFFILGTIVGVGICVLAESKLDSVVLTY